MATMMIRNVPDDLKRELRRRAADRGVSMEQEARDALARGVATPVGRRRKPILDELRKLGAMPTEPFDLKQVSDEMWDEGLR
ncbi:FitA-like ribbon-helix-helix domain-containing protein [Mesorhizobium marinum]|uniref:FitA-like ribbon-helix-helix domain-containing protein n=1 Tax=Mesorhizobium marinum TaxID=3228790 RepID=UPI0034656BBD